MKSLQKFTQQELTKSDMLHISGGVDSDQYCSDMEKIWRNNAHDWDLGAIEGWWIGWNEHCA